MLTRDPLHAQPRVWGEPAEIAPDVFMYPAFVNTYALRTPAGLLLVDPGFGHASGSLQEAVRGWSDAPLNTALYTHGHVDHAFGLRGYDYVTTDTPTPSASSCVSAATPAAAPSAAHATSSSTAAKPAPSRPCPSDPPRPR